MDRMVDLFHEGILDRLDRWSAEAPTQFPGSYRRASVSYSRGYVSIVLKECDGDIASVGSGEDFDGDRALDLALDDFAAYRSFKLERRALESSSSAERAATDSERDARGAAE